MAPKKGTKKGTKKGKAKLQKDIATPEPAIELPSSDEDLPARITRDDGSSKTAQEKEKEKGKAREVEVEMDADEVIDLAGSDEGEDEKERESSEEEIVVEAKRRVVVMGKAKKTRSDRVEEARKKIDEAEPMTFASTEATLNLTTLQGKADSAAFGVMMVRVAVLSKEADARVKGKEAMDVQEDEDGLLEGMGVKEQKKKEVRTGVQLKTREYNPRGLNGPHVAHIRSELARGVNKSRQNPILIAISKTDIVNHHQFVEERKSYLQRILPLVKWRSGVREATVLGGQHRIAAARGAAEDLAKSAAEAIGTLEDAQEEEKARLQAYNDAKDQNIKGKELEDVKTAYEDAQKATEAAVREEDTVRKRIDEVRFWPAIFYDKDKLKTMGSTRDQLLRFLSENTSEKIFPKTIDEEIYEGLWKVRDAKGKTEVIQHLNIEFGKAKTEVRLVLRNESTRPVLLKAISTSTGFRLSPIMTSKYWQPTRTSTEVPKLNGRPPALDMVTQLIGGSLTNMQVVFGPWWYEMEPDELRSRLKKHKLMLEGAIAKNEEEFKEFEKLVQLTHQVLVRRSRDDHRIQHNKELRGRNPPGIPIPRLEDLGVITDEMLDDLDRIFVSEYAHPMSHDFGHNAPDYRNKELAYIQKVSKYLDRYAQREVRGLDPSDYTERHHRLLRASVIFELYFTPFTDISCLPFPTKSMVEALWVALEPYDYAFVEMSHWADGLADWMVMVSRATAKNKLDVASFSTNPESATGVITQFLDKRMLGPAWLREMYIHHFYRVLFAMRTTNLPLLHLLAASSKAPRTYPHSKAFEDELQEGSTAFEDAWKTFKGFNKMTSDQREQNIYASLIDLSNWERPTKKGAAPIKYWVAVETHPSTLEEREGWIKKPLVAELRDIMSSHVTEHNASYEVLENNDAMAAYWRTVEVEWWDRLQPVDEQDLDTVDNSEQLRRELQLQQAYVSDTKELVAIQKTLTHSVLANNYGDGSKTFVLSEDMGSRVKAIVELHHSVLNSRRQHAFLGRFATEDDIQQEPRLVCAMPKPANVVAFSDHDIVEKSKTLGPAFVLESQDQHHSVMTSAEDAESSVQAGKRRASSEHPVKAGAGSKKSKLTSSSSTSPSLLPGIATAGPAVPEAAPRESPKAKPKVKGPVIEELTSTSNPVPMVIDPLPADSLASTSTPAVPEEIVEDSSHTEAASRLRTPLAPDTPPAAMPGSQPMPTAQQTSLPERMSSISISSSADPPAHDVEMNADSVSSVVADDMSVDPPVEPPRLRSPPVRAVVPPPSPSNSDPILSDEDPQPDQVPLSSSVPVTSRRNPVRRPPTKPDGLTKFFPAKKDFA